MLVDLQLDQVIAPTHHFGGLGVGNKASQAHFGQPANPKAAAFQSLDKMATVAKNGSHQLVLPPPLRPQLQWLESLSPRNVKFELHPSFISAAFSASSMWTANAATVSSPNETADGRTHLTIANLVSSIHRQLETSETHDWLGKIFADENHFAVHPALPCCTPLADEGAANHMRLWDANTQTGIDVFVHGFDTALPCPTQRFPARQSRLAFKTIATQHGLDPNRTLHIRQHPDAIDAGAFHNDVVAASHADLLLHHERAFADGEAEKIDSLFLHVTGNSLRRISVAEHILPLTDAVESYLFNSQIIESRDPNGTSTGLKLLVPLRVESNEHALAEATRWKENGYFQDIIATPLDQSMNNGGGPACLRLRVPVHADAISAIPKSFHWSESVNQTLRDIIQQRYRESVEAADLSDPQFIDESLETCRQLQAVFQ